MAIYKEIKVIITVRAHETDKQSIADLINEQTEKLKDFFYSVDCVADHKESNTVPACAGWRFTIIGNVASINDAYILDNKLKNFISRHCNRLIIEL